MTTDTTPAPDVAGLIERLERKLEFAHMDYAGEPVWRDDLAAREAAAMLRTLARVEEEAKKVCDSYAAENQRLYDRAEAAEAKLAAGADCPVCYGKEVTFYTSDNCPECSPSAQLRAINEMLDAGQGDDDGPQILPDFEQGMSVVAKVEACLHLLEKRRDVIEALATPPPAQEVGAEPVRPDAYVDTDWKLSIPHGSPLPDLLRALPKSPIGKEILPLYAHLPSLDRRGEWEAFCDISYYDMWCVRPKGENRWGHCFHVASQEEAEALVSMLAASPSHPENGR